MKIINQIERPIWRSGKKTHLCPLIKSDLNSHKFWINDPLNTQYLNPINPVSDSEMERWYSGAGEEDPDKLANKLVVAILTHEGTLIGNMFLGIDRKTQSAKTGTLIGDRAYQGKGYGTDAKMLILDYTFNWVGVRKVTSSIYSFNGRSKRYAEKCGYRYMATIEKELFRRGEWVDEDLFVVFREEWLPIWEEFTSDWSPVWFKDMET